MEQLGDIIFFYCCCLFTSFFFFVTKLRKFAEKLKFGKKNTHSHTTESQLVLCTEILGDFDKSKSSSLGNSSLRKDVK